MAKLTCRKLVFQICLIFIVTLSYSLNTHAQQILVPGEAVPTSEDQNQAEQPATVIEGSPEQGAQQGAAQQANIPVFLSVLKGNPQSGGGNLQQYQINNGESVFVEIEQPPAQFAKAQEKQALTYDAQLGQISDQIAQKVSAIQAKEQEYANEIYPSQKAPIELERQDLEKELRVLEQNRTQLEASHQGQQSQQKIESATQPPPKPLVAGGLKVQVSIKDDKLNFVVTPSGLKGPNAQQTSYQSAYGSWVQVFDDKDEKKQVWVKADPGQPPAGAVVPVQVESP